MYSRFFLPQIPLSTAKVKLADATRMDPLGVHQQNVPPWNLALR